MQAQDRNRVRQFFTEICAAFPPQEMPASVVVTHLLPDRPYFLEAISRQTHLALVLAKPKSAHQATKNWLANLYPIEVLRSRRLDAEHILEILNDRGGGRPAVLFDIGGYFVSIMDFLSANYSGGIAGIIEDTENGYQRYFKAERLAYPVISVARSPLKKPEDYLVGQSIVYSAETLLRDQGDILHGRTACVIGYGKLGRSIANLLHARHVRTVVYDIDPIKRVEAMSHGFAAAGQLDAALRGAGLVFCATGNLSLHKSAFEWIEDGAYIATVTSSDDELDLDGLRDWDRRQIGDYVTRYRRNGRTFQLLNRGQAVNFIHGAAVGPFIYLVQAEILASIARCASGSLCAGVAENDNLLRSRIAEIWLNFFGAAADGRVRDAH